MSEAMVKPPPKKPRNRSASQASSDRELASILQMFGNNRAYSILAVGHKRWVIHFEGDAKHTVVTFEGDKPVMKSEGDK